MTADNAILTQILTTLHELSERMAVVETDLKSFIRDSRKDIDDHEIRIRRIEALEPGFVTQDDMEKTSSARTRRFWTMTGIIVTAVIAIVVPLETIIAAQFFGA